MSKDLYVSNLNSAVTSEELSVKFGHFGIVNFATVAMEAQTGQSRGFGYVRMAGETEAQTAIESLNLSEWNGLVMGVCTARRQSDNARQNVHRSRFF